MDSTFNLPQDIASINDFIDQHHISFYKQCPITIQTLSNYKCIDSIYPTHDEDELYVYLHEHSHDLRKLRHIVYHSLVELYHIYFGKIGTNTEFQSKQDAIHKHRFYLYTRLNDETSQFDDPDDNYDYSHFLHNITLYYKSHSIDFYRHTFDDIIEIIF